MKKQTRHLKKFIIADLTTGYFMRYHYAGPFRPYVIGSPAINGRRKWEERYPNTGRMHALDQEAFKGMEERGEREMTVGDTKYEIRVNIKSKSNLITAINDSPA